MSTIAIIGAGFSGSLLALHLLHRCSADTTVVLVERRHALGCGQAYSTGNPSHLLNVRVGGMSAFRDRPDHFQHWLNHAAQREGERWAQKGDFVPRQVFGAYIGGMLEAELARRDGPRRLVPRIGDVVAAEPGRAGVTLHLADGARIEADLAVLATGNVASLPPPVPGEGFRDLPGYRADPWSAETLAGLDPAAPVLLIGTGLTAIDMVMSLLDRRHAGPIHALSRRGLLPQRHVGEPAGGPPEAAYPDTPLALLRLLRRQARAPGGDWRAVVDAMRPFTTDIWQLMPLAERARFLRHLRPYWEVHRHRMAPAVASRIEAAAARKQFVVHAGRITSVMRDGEQVRVGYRRRRSGAAEITVGRVVNCSGPAADYERVGETLLAGLLRDGWARPDSLRLGLDVTANCALRGADGAVSRRLFAVGPLTRPMFWEMTAVPDIRRQCELLAAHLAGLLPPGASPPPVPEPALFVI